MPSEPPLSPEERHREAPDPDAALVMRVLLASDRPMSAELLLGAAKAYQALRSSREREVAPQAMRTVRARVLTDTGWVDAADWRDAAGLLPDVGASGSNVGARDAAGQSDTERANHG